MSFKRILAAITGQYDKLIAAAAFLLLLLSVGFLGFRLSAAGKKEADFKNRMDRLAPEHRHAAAADLTRCTLARKKMDAPYQIGGWTNGLFVPEIRVWCVDCRRPIGIVAEVCPFCKTRQPSPPKQPTDRDQDDMLDTWEVAHELNPDDPTDAGRDRDGDGFTALEEFMADPQTDPMDPESHPPIGNKLCVEKITAQPFRLLFTSVSKMPDGSRKFAINDRITGATHFKKQGEDVGGYVLVKFEERFQDEPVGNLTRSVNRSILTLEKGGKRVPLTMGLDVSYVELNAVLIFQPDNSTFSVKRGESLQLKGKQYKVLRIDSQKETVVIERLSDGRSLGLSRCRPR